LEKPLLEFSHLLGRSLELFVGESLDLQRQLLPFSILQAAAVFQLLLPLRQSLGFCPSMEAGKWLLWSVLVPAKFSRGASASLPLFFGHLNRKLWWFGLFV